MDIVLNEKSLNGQFTEEQFITYMQEDMLPILQILREYNFPLYKAYDTYGCMVTPKKSLSDFLKVQGNPVLTILRTALLELSGKEPYWNDSIATKKNKQYITDISEVPNCITEAMEREGIVLSFLNDNFKNLFLQLQCDKMLYKVPNIYDFNTSKIHFDNLGYLKLWKNNSFYIDESGYKFEIRFREENHNQPHFHISNADYSASFSIPDVDRLAGQLKKEEEKWIVSWALRNMRKIVDLWNEYHPERNVSYFE